MCLTNLFHRKYTPNWIDIDWQAKIIDCSFKSIKISFWNEKTKANEEAELTQELTDEIRKLVINWNDDKSLFNSRIDPKLRAENGVFSTLWLHYEGSEETDFEEYEKASLFVIKDGAKAYLITSIHAECGAILTERWGQKKSFLF